MSYYAQGLVAEVTAVGKDSSISIAMGFCRVTAGRYVDGCHWMGACLVSHSFALSVMPS